MYSEHKLYGYARVSTEEQYSKGNSIEAQKTIGLEISQKFGFKEYVHFEEKNISGTTDPTEREECSKLLKLITDGEVKHLYFYEWDRISRDTLATELLRKLFIAKDVKIWKKGSSAPIDLTNPIDNLTSSILGVVATFEREMTLNRIKTGLEQSKQKGRWSGVNVPYGYKKEEDRTVVPDEYEMGIYHKMVAMVVMGKSITEITNWLNREKIPVKSKKAVKKGFIRRGEDNIDVDMMLWRPTVVSGILKSPLRKGERISNGKKYPFPAIISQDEWDKLQKHLESNKRFNRTGNKSKHFYLLKGLLFCKNHDKPLIGKYKKDERTYSCPRKRKEIRLKGEPPCPLPSPNIDYMDEFVWEIFTDVLADSEIANNKYKEKFLSKDTPKNKEELQSELQSLNYKIKNLKSQEDKLVQLHLNNLIDESIYKNRYDDLKNQKSQLTEKIYSLKTQIKFGNEPPEWLNLIETLRFEVFKWKKYGLKSEEKRELLRTFLSKITVEYKNESYYIEFHFKYPIVHDRNSKSSGLSSLKIFIPPKKTTQQNSATSEMV